MTTAADLARFRAAVRLEVARHLSRADHEVWLYNPDQPRDDHGRFGSGGGGVSLKPATTRAWTGKQSGGGGDLSKQDVGKLGEAIVLEHLRQTMPDAQPYNDERNNTPVDIFGNHSAIEVKTGLASNSSSAQQWRATIGQPGKAETAAMKAMTPDELRDHNLAKSAAIMQRKQDEVAKISAERGYTVQGKTLAVILDPATKTADVFEMPGFHLRVGWNSDQAKQAYVGSYHYAADA